MQPWEMNEDQRLLVETIRKVARERVEPRAAQIDRDAEYPQDMFDMIRELGLFALPFPEEYGGINSSVSACMVTEEFARVCYNTAYLLLVQWTTFGALLYGGVEEQKKRLLPGLASGELRAAISVTEPETGSDVANIRTRAKKVDGGYELTGTKIFCTNAQHADFTLVAAQTEAGSGHAGIGVFIVPKGSKGFVIARHEDKLGARGIPSSELHINRVFVPDADRLEGGFKSIMAAFNKTRPIIGARGVGLAQGAMDLAAEYANQRSAFNQPIGQFQGIRWMVADMAIEIEAARGLVHRAAAAVDAGVEGKELAWIAAKAKCFATDVAMKVATDAVQIFGSAGISRDVPIERYMRDAKVLQIVEGTNQIQRNIVSEQMLGRMPRG